MTIQFINFADSIAVKSGDKVIGVIERIIDKSNHDKLSIIWAYEPYIPNRIPPEEEQKAIYTKLVELNNSPNLLSQHS